MCGQKVNGKENMLSAVKNGSLSSLPSKSVTSISFIGFYWCRRFTAYPPGMIQLDCAMILHYVPVLFHGVSLNGWGTRCSAQLTTYESARTLKSGQLRSGSLRKGERERKNLRQWYMIRIFLSLPVN